MDEIIIEIYKILKLIQNNTIYLNVITFSNLLLGEGVNKIKTLNNKFISNIYIHLQKLYIYYKSISYEVRQANLQINLLICELFYKFCIMIYTNKKIIDDIIDFNSMTALNTRKSKRISNTLDNKYDRLKKFCIFINNNKKADYEIEINSRKEYLLYIFGLFNNDIFGVDITNNMLMPYDSHIIHTPLTRFNHIYKLENYANDLFKTEILESDNIDNICNYIKIIIQEIKKNIYIKTSLSYITLPQYTGICWFIAMLNGITYSDMNRNLLLSKEKRQSSSPSLFKSFVYYIINNITKTFKVYDKDKFNDCSLLLELKYKPLNILREIINNEVRSKNEEYYMDILNTICSKITKNELEAENISSSKVLKIIKNTKPVLDNWAINVFIDNILDRNFNFSKVLSYNPYSKDYTLIQKQKIIALYIYNSILLPFLTSGLVSRINDYTFDDLGLYFNQHHILSYLYDILNIDNNYYYSYNEDVNFFNIRQKKGITLKPNPEIIIIESCTEDNIRLIDTTSKVETIKKEEYITMNDRRYKLDYILHISNNNFTCKGLCHCISAIHYNNKEYVYDSKNYLYHINCQTAKKNTIYIPCPLLEQKWTDRINSNTCYKVEKCGFLDIDKSSTNSILKEVHGDICYTYDSKIIYVYVLT